VGDPAQGQVVGDDADTSVMHPRTGADPTAPPVQATPEPLVALEAVSHRFGSNRALSSLDLAVPPGRITVLLGPNGAGKTTAFRAITGALVPAEGTVRTFGLDPDRDGHLVRPRCGVVSAKPALYDRLSGRDNLAYSAELYGMRGDLRSAIGEAAERFGIADALDQPVGGYSTGMKTRLALARSILHRPELLLFDEPTSGLDPESSHAVLELIRELTLEGRTVVMCTHLLSEAEGLADHVVMMEGGTDMISGTPDELTRRFWPNPIVHLSAEDGRLLDRVANWPGVCAYRRDPAAARLELDDLSRLPDMVASLAADGARLTRVEPHVPTLEDLYFTIRRQAGGTTTSDDDAPGPLAPIAPRWGSVTPVAPPMHAPDDRSPLSGASFDAPSTPEESRR
jgi:ABC-type multidrug transport system ATPase subunit